MNTKPPKRIGNANTRYNTPLSAAEETQYQKWVKTLPVNLRDDYDYDLRGAWLAKIKPDQYGHMPDLYKKPWHPTFSMESYYSVPLNEGGNWDEDNFIPSNTNEIMDAIRQSPFYQYGDYPYASYANGGKIHIKKENRGKFTEAANRAGKSVQAYASQILANKEHYSPTLVKRANFARNASKWHADGGEIGDPKKMSKAQQDLYLKMFEKFKTPVFSGNNNVNVVPYKNSAAAYVSGRTQEPIWLQWQHVTGLPWSEAKKRGYTDGSYQQNMALQNYLQDGQFGSIDDMVIGDYNRDYLFPITAPNQYSALMAQREYLNKLNDNTVTIPYDTNHIITLTNAGNLTGATLPYDYIDTVYKNSQKYGYDPYIELGIIGRETRFGLDDPYTNKTTGSLAFTTKNENSEDYRGERTFTDMANNHIYWTFPLRSEINQIGRNNNLEEYIRDYGTPNPLDDIWWSNNYESDFNNARMRRLISNVNSYIPPNEHQSIIDSYNKGLYSNMDAINQAIEDLRKSPEIQKRLRELSNTR
jgi:hypothetical protein